MGGIFDAVGFGDPARGYEATREHFRAAVAEGHRIGEFESTVYYQLETPEGCGLAVATDDAGYLLGGVPYFHGGLLQEAVVDELTTWQVSEPERGGARARLLSTGGAPGPAIYFDLPFFRLDQAQRKTGRWRINLVGLGYEASSEAGESATGPYLRQLPLGPEQSPLRRCNVECRGRIELGSFLTNSRSGARLAYAQVDCGSARLEVVVNLADLRGGLAEGAYLNGSLWLVARTVEG